MGGYNLSVFKNPVAMMALPAHLVIGAILNDPGKKLRFVCVFNGRIRSDRKVLQSMRLL